jgi:hypothetical protein
MIYNIVVLCSLDHTQLLANELREQFTAEYSGVAYVIDQGTTWTKRHGFLVIEWLADELNEDLLSQLEQDERVKDLCPYTLPADDDVASLFSRIVATEDEEEGRYRHRYIHHHRK